MNNEGEREATVAAMSGEVAEEIYCLMQSVICMTIQKERFGGTDARALLREEFVGLLEEAEPFARLVMGHVMGRVLGVMAELCGEQERRGEKVRMEDVLRAFGVEET